MVGNPIYAGTAAKLAIPGRLTLFGAVHPDRPMKLVFRVRYQTIPGQSLWLILEDVEGGARELPMQWLNAQQWEFEFEADGDGPLSYHYQLREEGNGLKLDEWGNGRVIHPAKGASHWVADSWRSAGTMDEACAG